MTFVFVAEAGSGDVDSGAVVVMVEEPWTVVGKNSSLLMPGFDTAPLINPSAERDIQIK